MAPSGNSNKSVAHVCSVFFFLGEIEFPADYYEVISYIENANYIIDRHVCEYGMVCFFFFPENEYIMTL